MRKNEANVELLLGEVKVVRNDIEFKFNEGTINHMINRDHVTHIMEHWRLKNENEAVSLIEEAVKYGKHMRPGKKEGYIVYEYYKNCKRLEFILDHHENVIVSV